MPHKKIKVAFRLDDPSAISPIDIEQNLIALFRKHKAVCTFGVVPYITSGSYHDPAPCNNVPLTEEKTQLFRQAIATGSIDIALHGFEHKTVSAHGQCHSEFCGIEQSTQTEKIKQGKTFLEQALGTKITAFIPPWNTYDEKTIIALEENGITCLSANRYEPAGKTANFKFVPITLELTDLKQAITFARSCNDPDPAIIVLMHPYDFNVSGDKRAKFDFQEIDGLLQWLNEQDDIEIYSVSQLAKEPHEFSLHRYRSNQPSWLENIYPPILPHTESMLVYHSSNYARLNKLKKEAITVLLHSLTLVCGGILGNLLISILPQTRVSPWSLAAIPGLLLIVLVGRSLKQKAIYYRSFQLIILVLGLIVGLGFH